MYKSEELSSEASLAAIEFLLGMQCANGGWACFDGWNNRNRWLNNTPFGQGNEFFDPSVPDITGRILECFGLLLTRSDALYCKTGKKLIMDDLRLRISHACHTAIQYLRTEQDCYGRWGSRWHVNYLNGTSSVLCGIKFFPQNIHDNRGQSLEGEMVRRPLAWIKAVQNQDGGWGEGVSTYREGSERERADSTPTQTAWAIMGLLAHLSPTDIAIVKGIQYLVSTQTTGSYVSDEDGTGIGAGPGATWRQREYVSVGFPDILWLDYSSSRHGYPMMALGRWLHELKSQERVDRKFDAIH
jgi:squalene-hopene/tetraprenyl-beta-curcumene cyclase